MRSTRDTQIVNLWLESQASPHTRGCYRRDVARLRRHVPKPLNQITLGDLQSFAQSLIASGLAPISRVRTLAAISRFGDQNYAKEELRAELASVFIAADASRATLRSSSLT